MPVYSNTEVAFELEVPFSVLHSSTRVIGSRLLTITHIVLHERTFKISREIFRTHDYSLVRAYYFPIRGVGLVWSRQGAHDFLKMAQNPCLPVDIFFQNWLIKNGKGLSIWPPLVRPAGLDSDILGTVATERVRRKQKENRDFSFFMKKQLRLLKNNILAYINFLSFKS